MKKIKYYYVGLLFLCYGCGCIEPGYGPEPIEPKVEKIITIINHTDKEYKDNNLRSVCAKKSTSDGKWKLYYENRKIKILKEGATERDILRIDDRFGCAGGGYFGDLFLLSLNGGKRKIFFGNHDYDIRAEYTELDKETCKHYFVKWNTHPVWQEKDLTIHIREDRIEFSDSKIKETNKVRLTKTEYVDPHTLPFWWEDN